MQSRIFPNRPLFSKLPFILPLRSLDILATVTVVLSFPPLRSYRSTTRRGPASDSATFHSSHFSRLVGQKRHFVFADLISRGNVMFRAGLAGNFRVVAIFRRAMEWNDYSKIGRKPPVHTNQRRTSVPRSLVAEEFAFRGDRISKCKLLMTKEPKFSVRMSLHLGRGQWVSQWEDSQCHKAHHGHGNDIIC